jgi:hypothetical protein
MADNPWPELSPDVIARADQEYMKIRDQYGDLVEKWRELRKSFVKHLEDKQGNADVMSLTAMLQVQLYISGTVNNPIQAAALLAIALEKDVHE